MEKHRNKREKKLKHIYNINRRTLLKSWLTQVCLETWTYQQQQLSILKASNSCREPSMKLSNEC